MRTPRQSASRQYSRRFIVGMLAYSILVPVSIWLLGQIGEGGLRVAAALLPVVPIPFILYAFLRYLRSLDELERQVQLEALGLSVGLTGLVTFVIGFLENAGGPRLSMIWVFPMLIVFWAVGQIIAGRRFR